MQCVSVLLAHFLISGGIKMKDKIEMIKDEIEDVLAKNLRDVSLTDDTIATKALKEIQSVLKSGNVVDGNKSDFEIVEKIVDIFEKYEIDKGGCHDF